MATFSDKIRLLFEVDDKGSFGKLKRDINDAETATGKMKVGAKSLGDTIRNNATAAATAAGAAFVAFAAKGVQAFQDTALESGKFADATGVSVEEASRLKEVAGDLGIEFGTVQGALLRFNKAAADGSVDVEGFGNVVVKTAEGTTDSYQSFINAATAIGAIEDPAKRAEAAQKTFGRSYGEIAELMEMDAQDLKAALDGVSDSKLIDDEELAKAKRFRDAMDNLNDVVEDLQLAVGEMVVENADMIEDFTTGLTKVVEYADEMFRLYRAVTLLSRPTDAYREAVGLVTKEVDLASMSVQDFNKFLADNKFSVEDAEKITRKWEEAHPELKSALDATADAVDRVDRSAQDFTEEAEKAERATRDLENAYKSLAGELSDEEAWIGVENAIDDYRSTINDTSSSLRDKRLATVELKQELISYLSELEGVPAEKQTEILALINQAQFDEAERALGYLSRQRQVNVGVIAPGGRYIPGGSNIVGATGGIVTQPTMALIGEAGPEAVVPLNRAPGASPLPAGMGGGSMNITINTSADPQSVVRAIEQARRLYGSRWLNG